MWIIAALAVILAVAALYVWLDPTANAAARPYIVRFHAWLDPKALRFIKWLNGLALVIATGFTGFSQLHPNFPAEVQATLHLTPGQYMALSIGWPILVAYLVKRVTASSR